MIKSRLPDVLALMALLIFGTFQVYAQAYKVSSNNLVTNSTFNGNPTGSAVPNWTFSPVGKWNKESNLIYGEDLVIDALGTHTATPTFSAAPCSNSAKVVRFYYNEENTGPYTFNIKLGGQTIASFAQNGISAQSNVTIGTGNTATIDRKFLSEGTWNQSFIWNNIWHQVEIYVPNYSGDNLVFEYVRNGGISRKIRLDNVELYEAIPTPQVSGSVTITLPATYDLTTQQPTNASYTYKWYTKPDPVAANAVSTPTAVSIGTYYLFATPAISCGNNTTNISYPSGAFKVIAGGCGGEIVKDGSFSSTDASDSPTGFLVPKGDNTNNGGLNWKRNFTDNDNQNSIATKLGSTNAFTMNVVSGSTFNRVIYQENQLICQAGTKTVKFSFGSPQTGASIGAAYFAVYLATPPSDLFVSDPDWNNTQRIVNFYRFSSGSIQISGLGAGVTIKVDGANAGTGTNISMNTLHTIEMTVPETLAAYGGIAFKGNRDVNWVIDDVSVTVSAPVAQAPLTTTASVDCTTGFYNLYNATPSVAGYIYEWHVSNDANSALVADPAKAVPGTYFLLTKSACSGCPASTLTSITVNNSACVSISGKIFADYDGTANGVSTTSAVGQSAGMYAMLVNSAGNVVAYTKVNSDGTYTITSATSAASNYVKISSTQPTVGSAAPAYATTTPNYVYTSASAIGNTNYASGANGMGTSPLLGSATSVSGINFGLNSPPIASDEGGEQCALAANTAFTVPTIYGVDDDPTWRDGNTANGENGTLQKINIKSLNQTNGVLTYNGTPVTATTVIPSYNPALLVFTSGTAGASSFNFTYTFTDAANAESREVGTVSYSFVPNPTISGISTVAVGGTRNLTGSITPGAVPTAWTSSNPSVATVDNNGLVTGVAVGTATITYTDYIGCSGTMTMNVIAAACLKPATIDTGNTYPSKTGVTILTRTSNDNWPGIRQSAHIVMEGNNYGFVPNRVANPETTIAAPKIGMMVYDTMAKCLKVNMDGTSTGWKCLTTQTCPN